MTNLPEEFTFLCVDEEPPSSYYNGIGFLEFFVVQNYKDTFEFEIVDSNGCAGWLQEGLGVDYALTEEWIAPLKDLKEGATYRVHDITVHYVRGDGWTTDDDEDWEFGNVTQIDKKPVRQALYKAKMIWWRAIGCHIRNWRSTHD